VVKRKKSSTLKMIRRNKSFFSPNKANTFKKFFITTVITGFATGMGIVMRTWFVKAFMQTVDGKPDIIQFAFK